MKIIPEFHMVPPPSDVLLQIDQENIINCSIASDESTVTPQEYQDIALRAHKEMPVFIKNPFSRKPLFLFSDPGHLLKRD